MIFLINKNRENSFSNIFIFFTQIQPNDFKGYGTKLDILDRQTTKKYELVIPNGQLIDLGLDSLIVYQCISFDSEMFTDQVALIHLFKKKNQSINKKEETIFLGWIVKSSPSLVVIETSNIRDQT